MGETIRIAGDNFMSNQTLVHPLGLLAIAILGFCVLSFPRRWSVLPFLIMTCFVSSAQRIVIAGADFDFLRIMVLFGVVRLIIRKEYVFYVMTPIDISLTLWVISSIIFYVLRQPTVSAVVNRLGFAFDAFGMYFLFRCLVQDWRDIEENIWGVLLICFPLALLFMLENYTGHNLFSVFGGVPEITVVREGRLRCQGAFSHAILAGCFWASLIPLIASLWWKSTKCRAWAFSGCITSSIIIICCASSTPMMGIIAAIVGGLFFYFRTKMRIIRWAVLFTLIALHMVMNQPVWHLVCRVSAVGGSTGWHRFNLINQAIVHFNDWWFAGCSGQTVASWGIWAGDVTNQFILEGVNGGIMTVLLFIIVIAVAFRAVGRLWRSQVRDSYRLAVSWALGVSLFVHCIQFISVSYFGQIWILWYLLLAMIGSLSVHVASPTFLIAGPVPKTKEKIRPRNQSFSGI